MFDRYPASFIFTAYGAGNNWAKCYYTETRELIEVVDVMTKEAKSFNCLQRFEIIHSLGGNTRSGSEILLSLKMRNNCPDRIPVTFSVYPSPKVSDVDVEEYNAAISIEIFVISNEALYNIRNNILKHEKAKYAQLNCVLIK